MIILGDWRYKEFFTVALQSFFLSCTSVDKAKTRQLACAGYLAPPLKCFFRIPNNYFFSLENHLNLLVLSSCYSQEEKWLYKQYSMIPSVAILKGCSCLSLHPVHPPIPPSTCSSISHPWKGGTWHPGCLLLLWRFEQPLCKRLPVSLLCLIAGHYSQK